MLESRTPIASKNVGCAGRFTRPVSSPFSTESGTRRLNRFTVCSKRPRTASAPPRLDPSHDRASGRRTISLVSSNPTQRGHMGKPGGHRLRASSTVGTGRDLPMGDLRESLVVTWLSPSMNPPPIIRASGLGPRTDHRSRHRPGTLPEDPESPEQPGPPRELKERGETLNPRVNGVFILGTCGTREILSLFVFSKVVVEV